jgi:hypothetical protein
VVPGKRESKLAKADFAVLPLSEPAGTIMDPLRLEFVLYSNSAVVLELLGLTVAFNVAVVPDVTFVAASVVAEGELASAAEST